MTAQKLDRHDLDTYWSELSRRHLTDEQADLGAIIYAGMPSWFNRLIDVYQHRALQRLVHQIDITDKRILDVGTGIGRWARWYGRQPGNEVVGIDAEPSRLAAARDLGGQITYMQMPVDRLAFPEASFDIVNCIAVLQHVHHDVKSNAIAEFARVLRPGGMAILFELTDMGDDAAHTFPWPGRQWTTEFEQRGFSLQKTIGVDYLPLLRFLKTVYKAYKGDHAADGIAELKNEKRGAFSSALLAPLRLAIYASYPIEEVVRYLPPRYARMTCFLFERTSQ